MPKSILIFKFSPATSFDIIEVDDALQPCIYLLGLIMHKIDQD